MPATRTAFCGAVLVTLFFAHARAASADDAPRPPPARKMINGVPADAPPGHRYDACRAMFPEPIAQRVACLGRTKPEPLGNPGRPPAERPQPATKP